MTKNLSRIFQNSDQLEYWNNVLITVCIIVDSDQLEYWINVLITVCIIVGSLSHSSCPSVLLSALFYT